MTLHCFEYFEDCHTYSLRGGGGGGRVSPETTRYIENQTISFKNPVTVLRSIP